MEKYYNRRYPKGTPLGGQFIPQAVSLSSGSIRLKKKYKTKEKTSGKSRPYFPPSKIPQSEIGPFLASREVRNARATIGERVVESLADSLTRDDLGGYDREKHLWLEKNGLDEKDIAAVIHKVSDHASMLYATQLKSRPDGAKRIAKYSIIFRDFGRFPVDAIVDHDLKVIALNRNQYIGKNSKHAYDGSILSSLTHEYAHAIDHSLTSDNALASFTAMFKPLHEHLSDYAKKDHQPRWLMQSKLSYPLNGYMGMAQKDGISRQLSKEYISVISEMYWHNPEYLDKIDEKMKEDGYKGPSMREAMQQVWGNVNVSKSPSKVNNSPKDIDETSIHMRSVVGGNEKSFRNNWDSGYSKESYADALLV